MRDEQVRRYARQLMLPDVGGLGQTALMVSAAKLAMRESEPTAELVAGCYLAAGGVGVIAMPGSTDAQRAEVASRGPDTRVVADGDGRDVGLAPKPAWWPSCTDDRVALAYWRGAIAATVWMAEAVMR